MSGPEQTPHHESLMDLYRTARGLHNGLWPLIQDRSMRLLGSPIDISDLVDAANACGNGTEGEVPNDKQMYLGISGALAMSLGIVSRLVNVPINQWRLKHDEKESLTALFAQIKNAKEFYLATNQTFPELVLAVFLRVDKSFMVFPGSNGEETKERVNSQISRNFALAMGGVSLVTFRNF